MEKKYLLILADLVTRYCVLEVIDTKSFLDVYEALIRTIAICGQIQMVYCDRCLELGEAVELYNNAAKERTELQERLLAKDILIKFSQITGSSKHRGGAHERFVALTKATIEKQIGRSYITKQSLVQLSKEAMIILNARPLVQITSSVQILVIQM